MQSITSIYCKIHCFIISPTINTYSQTVHENALLLFSNFISQFWLICKMFVLPFLRRTHRIYMFISIAYNFIGTGFDAIPVSGCISLNNREEMRNLLFTYFHRRHSRASPFHYMEVRDKWRDGVAEPIRFSNG